MIPDGCAESDADDPSSATGGSHPRGAPRCMGRKIGSERNAHQSKWQVGKGDNERAPTSELLRNDAPWTVPSTQRPEEYCSLLHVVSADVFPCLLQEDSQDVQNDIAEALLGLFVPWERLTPLFAENASDVTVFKEPRDACASIWDLLPILRGPPAAPPAVSGREGPTDETDITYLTPYWWIEQVQVHSTQAQYWSSDQAPADAKHVGAGKKRKRPNNGKPKAKRVRVSLTKAFYGALPSETPSCNGSFHRSADPASADSELALLLDCI
ncbi:hypothetical protein V8E54_002705 [Elaphomyces granulatus]